MMETAFFNILEFNTTDTGLIAKVGFSPNHEMYEGHFPERAITPGVVFVDMINTLLAREFPNLKLVEVRKCRFTAVHEPGDSKTLMVEITVAEKESDVRISASVSDDNQTYLKFQANYIG